MITTSVIIFEPYINMRSCMIWSKVIEIRCACFVTPTKTRFECLFWRKSVKYSLFTSRGTQRYKMSGRQKNELRAPERICMFRCGKAHIPVKCCSLFCTKKRCIHPSTCSSDRLRLGTRLARALSSKKVESSTLTQYAKFSLLRNVAITPKRKKKSRAWDICPFL